MAATAAGVVKLCHKNVADNAALPVHGQHCAGGLMSPVSHASRLGWE